MNQEQKELRKEAIYQGMRFLAWLLASLLVGTGLWALASLAERL